MTRVSRSEDGFTLIEVLTVVVIIGILAGIAIAQFAEYKRYSFDARARSDLRNVATAEEAYFIDTEMYKSCTLSDGVGTCQQLGGLADLSDGVDLQIVNVSDEYFTGTATHTEGSGQVYSWNSINGGLLD